MALACCLPWMLPLFIPIFMFFWKPIYNALPAKQQQFVDDMVIMMEIWINNGIDRIKNMFGLSCETSCCSTESTKIKQDNGNKEEDYNPTDSCCSDSQKKEAIDENKT